MSRVEHIAEGVTDKWVTIYALCEPIDKWRTGPVRYVGKTVRTAWQRVRSHSYVAKNNPRLPVHFWLRKHMRAGDPFHIRHLEHVPPGQDWIARERLWIAKFKNQGVKLLNLTEGGEGLSGHKLTSEHRSKIGGRLRRGAFFDCETCGTEFWRKPRDIKNGDCRFCSRGCYAASLRGVSRPVHDVCKVAGAEAAAAKRRAQTHCKRGHPLNGANLYLSPKGGRVCKECRKLHKRISRGKRR